MATSPCRFVSPLSVDLVPHAVTRGMGDALHRAVAVQPIHILVVDPNPIARAALVAALARKGRTVEAAGHAAEALERASARVPDLVITDSWTLVKHLRATPATAFVHVIFMTAHDAQWRVGADDYIAKPVRAAELEVRVQNTLLHARRSIPPAPALSGELSQFSLATALSMLELERRTGCLVLERQAQRAVLQVKNGRVVRSEVAAHPNWSVVDCVGDVLMWPDGRFSFTEQPVDASGEVMATTTLLLEASRKLDELIPVDAA